MKYKYIVVILYCVLMGKLGAKNEHSGFFNPGYVGKKTVGSLTYSPSIRIGLNIEGSNTNTKDYSAKKMRHTFELGLERTISKIVSFNIAYGISSFDTKYAPFYKVVYDRNGNQLFFPSYALSSDVSISNFHVGVKFYNQNKGAIAPLGNYFHVFYGKSTVNVNNFNVYEFDRQRKESEIFNEQSKVPMHDDQFKYTFPYLGFGFGKNRIVNDRFLLGFELRVNIKLKPAVNISDLDGYSVDKSEFIHHFAREINQQTIISLYFKGGYLF